MSVHFNAGLSEYYNAPAFTTREYLRGTKLWIIQDAGFDPDTVCRNSPGICLNGGECIYNNIIVPYRCNCITGYTGLNCEFGPFISILDTSLTSSGSSNPTQIKLPLLFTGRYNFTINCGDGSTDIITSYTQLQTIHNYVITGVYTITISGTIIGWRFSDMHHN